MLKVGGNQTFKSFIYKKNIPKIIIADNVQIIIGNLFLNRVLKIAFSLLYSFFKILIYKSKLGF